MSESEADKIRNKRLAKLGGGTGARPSENNNENSIPQHKSEYAAPQPPSSDPASSDVTSTSSTTADTLQTDGHEERNPFSKLGLKAQGTSAAPPSIHIKPAATTPAKRDAHSASRPVPQQRPAETLENWEDRTLSSVFRVALAPEQTADSHGNTLYFLSEVRADLVQAGRPIKLNTDVLDQALIEVASDLIDATPLAYFLRCWKRLASISRGLRNGAMDEAKALVIKNTRRICVSYCFFAVSMPDMFGQESSAINPLTQFLLADPECDRGIDQDFLAEAVLHFQEDETVRTTLVEAIEQLSSDLAKLSMNDDYRPYMTALTLLARFPPILVALSESARFVPPNAQAQDIETQSTLGPFFRLSPLQGDVATNYFSNPKSRDRGFIANSQNALRMTLQQHQVQLFDITDRIVRASKESRERVLDWFALTVNVNHKRRAMRTDPRYVSSDGFMVNVTVCLDRLCEPFMDATFSKISRIEVEYLRRSPRVSIQDETKINADEPTSDKFYAEKLEGSSNFITEVFFLTVAAHHYGTEAVNSKLSDLRRNLKHMDKELERIEQEREKYLNRGAAVLAIFDQRMKAFKDQVERGHCVMMATEGVLADEQAQARAMSFMRYVIVWLMRLVSNVDFPQVAVQLPLPAAQPDVFKCLPEYFVEDIVDHFKFITGHMPHVIVPTQCDELVTICITFLSSTEYIKNPYLKSGLVAILFHGVIPTRTFANGILGNILNSLSFAVKHLLHALMNEYIECEFTGAHGQFYDKFNIRYEVFQVIKCIWGNAVYRDQLATEAKVNTEFFVRFVNLLLNDVTFVLDESFTAFHQINSLTKELADRGATMEEAVKTEKEEALEAAKGKAKSYMQLTVETLAMLKLFTDALADTFTMPEIVQRLADMLDYNLDALTGPKQRDLKVDNPQQYNFNPAALLSDIVDVFLNLGKKEAFHMAVARDGRSYKPANFAQAARILAKYNKKSPDELQRWTQLCDAIAQAKANDDAEEEDLGEVPDEFLDPILATLMLDPVILPTSKQTIDRGTIRQMLLSDPLDPFNRSPLKLEDVAANVELKVRIDAFRAEKRGKKAETPVETMDMTDG